MANRQLLGPSKGTGSGKNVAVASTSSSSRRKRGGSSNRPQLSLSSRSRVLTNNPAVLEWLTHSSTSSQVTRDVHSKESVGSSDTTLSWHGPGTAPMPSPVQNLPLAYAAPSPSQVMIAAGPAPLFIDDEFCEDRQQLQANSDLEERSAADSFRRATIDDDSKVGAHVMRGRRNAQETGEGDTSDDQTFIVDDVAHCTWKLEEEEASSSSEGKGGSVHMRQQDGCVSMRQQGGRSGRSGAKRGRGTPSATQKTPCEEHTSNAWVHKSSSRQTSCGGGGKIPYSAVWKFFTKSLGDVSVAVCKICGQKVRRGQGANVGTTALRQHMERHHKVVWENRATHLELQHDAATAASPTGLHPLSSSQGSSTSAEGSYPSFPSTAMSIAPDAPTPTPYHVFRQQSITEAIAKRQQYACTHPTAQKLNVHLAKLLVLQSLPFQVVDSAHFRELMACAHPRWRVPSRHYFSKKAVPALHTYIEQKVGQSLGLSVSGKVHASADIWRCNYGQGQYMSFTVHWVNVVPAQAHQQFGQVMAMPPPRCNAGISAPKSSSACSSSTLSSPSSLGTVHSGPPAYHLRKARRCHAVLHLVSLAERSHSGEELLRVIDKEIKHWLSPRQLEIGTMVTYNGKNILSALRQGGLTHVPCMAHVFNLVVTRFLKSSTELQELLKMSRKLCMHFNHSYSAKHTLLELQRQNALPQHRLICDVSTCWNSTLHMLDRLYEQRKAVNDFLMLQTDTFTPQCNFHVNQWQLVHDTCRLLRPFEEATLFVNRQNYGMNDVIPLLHILEGMLRNLIGEGIEDMVPSSHSYLSPEEDELAEEEDEENINTHEFYAQLGGLSAQSIGEEQEGLEEQEGHEMLEGDDEDSEDDPDRPWQYAVEMEAETPSESLEQMARCMLSCLRSDSRIVKIRQTDDYWLSTLLDPRYRSKMGAFFRPSERDAKMDYYRDMLCSQLVAAYQHLCPSTGRSDLGDPLRSSSTPITGGGSGGRSSTSSISSNLNLESLMSNFLQPPTEENTEKQQQWDIQQNLKQQVVAYLDCTPSPVVQDPLDYWACKLEVWPQLAEFAMGMLSCPASSVASERVFCAAGGIVTPKRTRLSSQNVERLTFIKMNQMWISQDFQTPVPDATE